MKRRDNMIWITEALALVFGMLILLIIFGDSTPIQWVGNLDTIFGHEFWPLMDVIYPLASVIVFLGYGKSKGAIRFRFTSVLLFLIFLFSLVLMQFDDIVAAFNHPTQLSDGYWTAVRWIYLVTAIGTFLTFGKECEKTERTRSR